MNTGFNISTAVLTSSQKIGIINSSEKKSRYILLGDEDIKMNTENMYENFHLMNELHTIATVQLVLKVNYWQLTLFS